MTRKFYPILKMVPETKGTRPKIGYSTNCGVSAKIRKIAILIEFGQSCLVKL